MLSDRGVSSELLTFALFPIFSPWRATRVLVINAPIIVYISLLFKSKSSYNKYNMQNECCYKQVMLRKFHCGLFRSFRCEMQQKSTPELRGELRSEDEETCRECDLQQNF
jgi:hypothetical protein